MSQNIRIERYRGDTYPIDILVKDSSGNSIDVAGHAFVLTASTDKFPEDTSSQVFSINGNLNELVDGSVSFPVSLVNADNLGSYYFDIEMTDSDLNVRTIAKGEIVFIQDISK